MRRLHISPVSKRSIFTFSPNSNKSPLKLSSKYHTVEEESTILEDFKSNSWILRSRSLNGKEYLENALTKNVFGFLPISHRGVLINRLQMIALCCQNASKKSAIKTKREFILLLLKQL